MEDPSRRRFLGGLTGAATLLAGCSGSSGEGSSVSQSTPTPTATPEPPTTAEPTANPEAEENLDQAYNAIGSAGTKIVGEIEKLARTMEYVDFKTGEINAHLARAEREIASAEPVGEHEGFAESLQSIVAWLRPISEGLSVYDEGVDLVESGETYVENDRIADAAGKYATASDRFTTVDEHMASAEDAFEQIILEPLGDSAETDIVKGEEAVQRLDGAAEGMAVYTQGGAEFMAGIDAFIEGARAFSEERYGEVVEPMESARSQFSTAYDTATEAEDVAPKWLLDYVLNLSCQAGAYRDTSGHYIAATEDMEAGNDAAAQEAIEAANKAMNRCS